MIFLRTKDIFRVARNVVCKFVDGCSTEVQDHKYGRS